MNSLFRRFATRTAEAVGSPGTFLVAVLVILCWAATGPLFHYSNTWQLIINTSTTIVTFLMVFLIQNTQNRDARAIHLKLDELIRAVEGARNGLIDLENLSDEELLALHTEFEGLRQRYPVGEQATAAIAKELEERRADQSRPAEGPAQSCIETGQSG